MSKSEAGRDDKRHDETVRGFLASLAAWRCYVCGWPLAKNVEDGCVPFNCSMRYSDDTRNLAEKENWQRRATAVAALHAWAVLKDHPGAGDSGNHDTGGGRNDPDKPAGDGAVDGLPASPARPPLSAVVQTFAPYWLVECATYTPRRYWTMHPHQANTWETDPAKAIRYSTREEAMRVVMMLPEECEACEHMDCGEPGPVLDKPALIGATRFGVGVSWSTVIDRAQREYEYRTGQDADAANLLATVASSATGPSEKLHPLCECQRATKYCDGGEGCPRRPVGPTGVKP